MHRRGFLAAGITGYTLPGSGDRMAWHAQGDSMRQWPPNTSVQSPWHGRTSTASNLNLFSQAIRSKMPMSSATTEPYTTTGWRITCSLLPPLSASFCVITHLIGYPGIQRVTQTVANKIERQNGEKDHKARENAHPPRVPVLHCRR
jgi:hypothetical protein